MRQIELQKISDDAPFTRFHGVVLLWCALAIVFDGYDLAVVGIALPSIMKEMGIDATQAGFMASSALFGMMFGNVVFGGLADRFGRRLVLCLCIAIFSLFTAAAGLTKDPISFSVMRFIAGLGIGGVMPNVIAQMTDYSPLRMRSTLITLTFSGYSVGGMLAAILGKNLIQAYGWQTVFLAAAAPVVFLPLIWLQMPESLGYLVRKGRTQELKRIVGRMSPDYTPREDDQFVLSSTPAAVQPKSSFGELFADGRGFSTLMFWLTAFMALFMVYALNSWLTKLMNQAGYSLGSALTFVLVLNIGATVGAIFGGWLADRFHIKAVTFCMFVLAAISITLMGHRLPIEALFLVVGIAGACTIGTQTMTCAYCSQFYPTSVRATGVGMMLGVGRAGAILAPIVIGMIVNMNLSLESNFMAIAIPAIVAACSILLVQHGRSDLVLSRQRGIQIQKSVTNNFLVGVAFQAGTIPLKAESIEQAIQNSGVGVEQSLAAFRWGRMVVIDRAFVEAEIARHQGQTPVAELTPEARAIVQGVNAQGELLRLLEIRVPELIAYQDAAYAKRYAGQVARVLEAERRVSPEGTALSEAVARYLYKLMAYKDEYEVARLHADPAFLAQLDAQFPQGYSLEYHLAPPSIAKKDPVTGHLIKRSFGGWMQTAFRWLSRFKGLRGGAMDFFGKTEERHMERQLISEYEQMLGELSSSLKAGNLTQAVALASVPDEIRGYGHVKEASVARARQLRDERLAAFRNPPLPAATPVREQEAVLA